ncbi:hypothetical protein HY488_02420 [Candidatus Woesearchaeota archaeon]|nr:hypothetical protein [Candidatus Woesearchaeota archaeon]
MKQLFAATAIGLCALIASDKNIPSQNEVCKNFADGLNAITERLMSTPKPKWCIERAGSLVFGSDWCDSQQGSRYEVVSEQWNQFNHQYWQSCSMYRDRVNPLIFHY